MSIFEYNAQLHEETLKKEAQAEIIQNILSKGYSPKEVADLIDVSLNEVLEAQKLIILR